MTFRKYTHWINGADCAPNGQEYIERVSPAHLGRLYQGLSVQNCLTNWLI
jgi:hypothetical protein